MNHSTPTMIIDVTNLTTVYGKRHILKNLNLQVRPGDILGIIGGSGAGKTTLLRNILMLTPYETGSIKVLGHNIAALDHQATQNLQRRWGVMFQQGALFSTLKVWENIAFPLSEFCTLPKALYRDIALLKMELVGLPLNTAELYPAELSGGMLKRVAVARAIAMDPELLFLDEPTAGLDPYNAHKLDQLIIKLHHFLGLTVIIVTHDLATLWNTTHRVAFLGAGKVLQLAPMATMVKETQPLIKRYFSSPRTHIMEP